MRFGILTVSDRSSRGERPDRSGPALKEKILAEGWQVLQDDIVPDDILILKDNLARWADGREFDVILTTGGTGFAPRDVTPEATQAVIQRSAPGLVEAMRAESLKITPHAMLSRSIAGIRDRTLIVNLPGSPKAALENLNVIIPVLPHAVELLHEDARAEAGHQF
ncbi:MAG: MogA/MoaB family molybdenum cofactor biosynthesis protein [Anaerolineales bacterium]|nr:MogA/MoaB family molybdenum cofactor biosynthesis protein [Chloroflexota bacterium]MBL6980448.1 MogA/MoaB family molybdenum cofactor biosynthesis protein [Anaerolineales bacterium]